jgi:dihydropteroate synthase
MLTLHELARLESAYAQIPGRTVAEFELCGRTFPFNSQPAIMGVINLSPESWYRESVCLTVEQALRRGKVLHAQGAALVDLGAESTLALAERKDAGSQCAALIPVIQGLRNAGILVSVETYDELVAKEALEAGANVLNLTGTQAAAQIYALAAAHEAAVIICYVQGPHVRDVADFDMLHDPLGAMLEYFAREVELAQRAGVRKIMIDPGLGFYYRNLQDSAVRVRFQMQIFLQTFRLRALGFPVCHALPHAFEYFGEEVRSAEPFFAVLAAIGKTDLYRTHEVSQVKAVLDTLAAYAPPHASRRTADMV